MIPLDVGEALYRLMADGPDYATDLRTAAFRSPSRRAISLELRAPEHPKPTCEKGNGWDGECGKDGGGRRTQ
jgi:hypothetical protein